MNLADAKEITINNKDVKEISINNKRVWKKIIDTRLTLDISVTEVVFNDSFTITAILKDESGALIDNAAVKIYDGSELIQTGTTLDGVFSFNHSGAVGEHYFTAVFEETAVYGPSTSEERYVHIIKDTPKLTVLTGNIYSGWSIGAQLKDSKGNVLSGKSISLSGGTTAVLTTNSSGKVTKSFSGTAGSSYTVTWTFAGDDHYQSVSVSKKFNILSLQTQSKCSEDFTSGPDTVPYREWSDYYTDCDDNYAQCNNIATASGSHKRPAQLSKTIYFSIPSGATISSCKASWKSAVLKSSGSAYPSIGAPTVTITSDGSGLAHTATSGTPGKGSYVSGSLSWTGATVTGLNNGLNLVVSFPANTAGSTGALRLIGPKVVVTYRPAQPTI